MEFLAMLVFAAATPADPPAMKAPPSLCVCRSKNEVAATFEGVAVDAEMILAANGKDVAPRQATIFRVMKIVYASPESTVKERKAELFPTTRSPTGELLRSAKVWHVVDPDSCGVRFAYGRRYTVKARLVGGAFETDSCLSPAAANSNQRSVIGDQ
jgi:hypothetical protein